MESNIKGLVTAGHEMASELKAECGAVDMRSVAKLISDLATQLEVQLVRANALAAENATLNDKMNRLLVWPGIEFYSSAWEFCNLDGNDALEFMCDNKTTATDAFLAEVRAQGVEMFADHLLCPDLDDTIRDFAAQLRKGGNQ